MSSRCILLVLNSRSLDRIEGVRHERPWGIMYLIVCSIAWSEGLHERVLPSNLTFCFVPYQTNRLSMYPASRFTLTIAASPKTISVYCVEGQGNLLEVVQLEGWSASGLSMRERTPNRQVLPDAYSHHSTRIFFILFFFYQIQWRFLRKSHSDGYICL